MTVHKKQLKRWGLELREGDGEAGRGLAEFRWGQDPIGPPDESDDDLERAKAIAILGIVLALFSRVM